MSYAQVRKLLETRVAAWASAQMPGAIPVSYENKSFDRPEGNWIRATVIHRPVESLYIDRLDKVYFGTFWINLYTKRLGGMGEAEAIVASLQAHFPNNLKLNDGSFVLRTITPLSINGRPENDDRWLNTALVLDYRAAIDWA